MSNEQPTRDESLSARIRRETASDHRNAEGGDVMTKLLGGALPIGAYLDLVVQMQALYAELESWSARHSADPRFGGFFDPVLHRSACLEVDRRAVESRVDSAVDASASTATKEFVGRLAEIGSTPLRLLAHHYTRYMGDLSGGIMIGRAVDRAYGFDGGPGVTWFQFPAIADVDAYKNAYRARLDGLGLDATETDLLISEIHLSYTLNGGVLRDLSNRHA